MLVFEFKTQGKESQFVAIDDAIRTMQFVRNKALRYWLDNPKATKYDLNKQCAILAKEFPFANELNSTARQAAAERAWSAISRFFENCKSGVLEGTGFPDHDKDPSSKLPGKKGFPQFQKDCRSVEYKASDRRAHV